MIPRSNLVGQEHAVREQILEKENGEGGYCPDRWGPWNICKYQQRRLLIFLLFNGVVNWIRSLILMGDAGHI